MSGSLFCDLNKRVDMKNVALCSENTKCSLNGNTYYQYRLLVHFPALTLYFLF